MEEARLDVRFEYTSALAAEPSEQTVGRRTTVPVHLRFLPSLQVQPLAVALLHLAYVAPRSSES